MTTHTLTRTMAWQRWLAGAAVVAAATAFATCAQAGPVTVLLDGAGQTLPDVPDSNGVLPVTVLPAMTNYTLQIDGQFLTGWQLQSQFGVQLNFDGSPIGSQGSGRYFDPAGTDAVEFVFEGVRDPNDPEVVFLLTYDITGGSGRFAGADGDGFETVRIAPDFSFTGAGRLNLTVPEPGSAALAVLALTAIVGLGRRRRVARCRVAAHGC